MYIETDEFAIIPVASPAAAGVAAVTAPPTVECDFADSSFWILHTLNSSCPLKTLALVRIAHLTFLPVTIIFASCVFVAILSYAEKDELKITASVRAEVIIQLDPLSTKDAVFECGPKNMCYSGLLPVLRHVKHIKYVSYIDVEDRKLRLKSIPCNMRPASVFLERY